MAKKITDYGKWTAYDSPFRHYQATDLFGAEDYARISANFQSLLKKSDESEDDYRYKFRKSKLDYDAKMIQIDESIAPLFTPFFEEDFICSMADLLDLPYFPQIHSGLHSSPKGSRDGWLHTDHCSGWFDDNAQVKGNIIFQADCGCEYFRGKKKRDDALPAEYVRVATLLFYLCNDEWQEGDGGETGLFEIVEPDIVLQSKFIRPENNTALVFACTPSSYHRFIANPGITRNSLILGLHTSLEYAETIWGDAIKRRSAV
ncbi:MAG TPA: 2OG-Fe(II) oxygenase [Mucilaginibacter sp.]|nr:2OG-Fe(II) oxygenase [Mucilaginibacter sp.]